MDIKQAFATALKQFRLAQGLTQEAFSDISSRTYMSSLERNVKSPTIEKVDSLAKAMGVHPLSIMTKAYLIESGESEPNKLIDQIKKELKILK